MIAIDSSQLHSHSLSSARFHRNRLHMYVLLTRHISRMEQIHFCWVCDAGHVAFLARKPSDCLPVSAVGIFQYLAPLHTEAFSEQNQSSMYVSAAVY